MRLTRKVEVTLSSDAAAKLLLAKRSQSVTDDTLTVESSDTRSIAAATNVQIDLGGISTVKALYVEFSAPVKLRFQQAGEATPLTLMSAGQTGVFYAEISAAAVWIENESATAEVAVHVQAIGS